MSEIFTITISCLGIITLLYAIKLILNSKCDNCSICFGLIKFHRNINKEIELDKYKIDHNIDDLEGLNNNVNNVLSYSKNTNIIK